MKPARERAENAFNQGINLLIKGFAEESIAWFDQALQCDGTYTKALQQRSFVLCTLGEPVQALSDCNLALTIDSRDPMNYLHRAMVQNRLQNFHQAVDDCTIALNLDANMLIAYTERGSAHCELREYLEAIADFSVAIRLNPTDPVNYICRAVAYDEIGKYQETISDFTAAIELDSSDPVGYFSRALAYHKVDELEKAVADYDKVIALDPNFMEARQNRQIALEQFKPKRRGERKSIAKVANSKDALAQEPTMAKVIDIFTRAEIKLENEA